MRKMFSEKQIKRMVAESSPEVVEALQGQDISVDGITSKGIANTGGFANIGNVAVSGDITSTQNISAPSIIQTMSGFSVDPLGTFTNVEIDRSYVGVVQNGNKLTIVVAGSIKRLGSTPDNPKILSLNIPEAVGDKLINNVLGILGNGKFTVASGAYAFKDMIYITRKTASTILTITFYDEMQLTQDTDYAFRIEQTFLLGDNLASNE